jgi:uncharacterized membrane protein
MILNTDFLAILLVTVVALFVTWDARRLKSPVYPFMKILLVVIALIWAMALGLYFKIN